MLNASSLNSRGCTGHCGVCAVDGGELGWSAFRVPLQWAPHRGPASELAVHNVDNAVDEPPEDRPLAAYRQTHCRLRYSVRLRPRAQQATDGLAAHQAI